MADYSVKIITEYLGDLSCEITHEPSGKKFLTDAPLDNKGKARYISPTDLAVASISSCVITIMGIVANNNGIDIDGMKITAEKFMVNEPFRRIGAINLEISFPDELSEKEFSMLSNVVKTCPVTRSLSKEVTISYTFLVAGVKK